MTRLNKNASELMLRYNANACTDVTGFGLAGHSMQMALESKKVFHFFVKSFPIFNGAIKAIENNFLTRGDKSNRLYTKEYVSNIGNADINLEHSVYDPQTSGGLLISVPENNSNSLLKALIDGGDESSCIVGQVKDISEEFGAGTLIFDYN
jgi:selenide,water dikinase